MSALNDIDDAVKARLDFNRGELTDAAMFTDRKVWMRPFGSWVDQKNSGDYYGYSGSTGGLVIGADANVTTELQLGLAFGYAQANIKGNTPIKSNSYDLDTYQVLGYGRYELGQGTELDFQAGLGMNKNKGTRQLSLQGTTAKSSYDSTTASAGLGLRHQLKINSSTTFTPEVRADYGWISDAGYTETGAQALNLIVKGRDYDQLMLSAGGYMSYDVQKGLVVRAGLAVGYDALNSQARITSAYSGAPQTTFVTDGIDPSPWQLMGSLALVGELANGMQISATYGASYRQDFLNQNVSLNLRIGF
jgi:outer membrane autotransporter protein